MADFEIIEPSTTSRQFQLNRRVALADTDPSGRLRLDACARYLQDVAAFDAIDADISQIGNWVLRENNISIASFPTYGQAVNSKTYLTGSGRAWVERTSVISDVSSGATLISAQAIWVLTNLTTGAPASVPERLYEIYGPLALKRRISIRNTRPQKAPDHATKINWQIRYSDQDILSHLNNATYLEVVEEVAYRQDIKLAPQQHVVCSVLFKESTSYDDQSEVLFTASNQGSVANISVYFVKNGLARTTLDLKILK